jgi:hypothetical protein
MTEVLPQSQLGPVIAIPAVTGLSRFDIISDTAREVKRLKPVPTVWGRSSGRPIYDRLPGASEGYRLDYFGDEKIGLVYIDPQFGTLSGPGSLEVGRLSDNGSILVIQSGTITWSFGQIPTTGLAIDLRSIVADGVQDGVYQVGYYLDYTQPEDVGYVLYKVTDYSLSNTPSVYAASSEANYFPVEFAFSEIDDGSWRPDEFGDAGDYENGSSVFIDFTTPVTAEEFKLGGSQISDARCALYSSEDAIVWSLDAQSFFDGSWRLNVSRDTPARYWKFYFWNGKAEVTNILYSGEALFPNQRPSGPISTAEPFFEDDEFAEIDRPYILLAKVEVKNQQVVNVEDLRRQTSTKYEPVAKWLTDFQDRSLRSLITDISDYSSRYMAPPTAAEDMYLELSSETFLLESEVNRAEIIFPDYVKLEPGWTVVLDAELQDDPLGRGVRSDPGGIDIFAENISFPRSNSSVTPSEIIFLADPTGPGDLATKVYVDSVLIPSLDNGKY